MQITKELFVVPERDQYILYAPLENSVLAVNPAVLRVLRKIKEEQNLSPEEKTVLEELKSHKIIKENGESPKQEVKPENEYSPTSLTLLPTYNCNLRCVYCYSRGGENPGKAMDFNVAKSAIDLLIKNSEKQNRRRVDLGFHGGGEPLLSANMDFVKRVVEYFKSRCEQTQLKPNISGATNGVITPKNLEWVVANFTNLNISLDGPEDIQNSQRPKPNNQPSYYDVMQTIAYLEAQKFKYGIRATITSDSVGRMSEIVEFFDSITSNKRFHLEPLFECGRCKTTKATAPDPKTFFERFIEARRTGEKLGVDLYYSGSRLGTLTSTFCGATGKNFFVTPEGNVTTCLEVSRESDKGSNVFFVGSYNPQTDTFDFNKDRINYLQFRTVDNIPHCRNCFAKYNCAGDCPGKIHSETGDIFNPTGNSRCLINRMVLIDEINTKLGGKNANNSTKR